MKQKKSHPAIEAAHKKAVRRYLIFGVGAVICLIILALGFFIKPKAKKLEAVEFTKTTAADTYATVDVCLTTAMYEQDQLDDEGKVKGTNYLAIAVDGEDNKFMISVPKEYYEENIKELEDNCVQDIQTGTLGILDYDKKVTLYGYSIEMSKNLTDTLSSTDNEYNKSILSVVYPNVFEVVTEPVTITGFNVFYVVAGAVGIVSLIILMMAVSASADVSRLKQRYEEKLAKKKQQQGK
ncbi:MAG: hypothetical protein K5755_01635 [Clostridiales bacterium]|nr:hypothetical protein [Clostridiales bacterium]